jgi:hypothetical protein
MKIASIIGMLVAVFPRRLRSLLAGLCSIIGLPMVLMGIFVRAAFDEPASASVVAMCMGIGFAMDVVLAWAIFAHGSRVLLANTRSLQIPGVARAWSATVALFVVVSVLVPAIFFSMRWNVFAEILPLYLCAAAAVMLLMTIPTPTRPPAFFWPAWFACMLLLQYPSTFQTDRKWTEQLEQLLLHGSTETWALSAVLCALAVWRWRVLILHSDATNPARQGAVVADAGDKASVANDIDREKRLANAGTRWPIVAMRYWLAGPFAPKTWTSRLWLLVAVPIAALIVHKIAAATVAIALGIAMLPLTIYWAQLRRLFAKQGGEMAELALLPGWGDRVTTRRTLLTAVFQPMANYLIAALVAIEILALLVHVDATTRWSLACSLAIAASAGAAYCLYALAHRPPAFVFNALLICVGIPLGLLCVVSCMGIHWIDLPVWLVATAIVCGVVLLFARSAWSDFRQRAHPFLME